MGSIFFHSTVTLAATDAWNSSMGLFMPATPNTEYPWLGIIALDPSFGDRRGQVYVASPDRGVTGAPSVNIDIGVLQSRGWVMQERALALRTIHFLRGQLAWECSVCLRGQGALVADPPQHIDTARTHLKTLQRAFEGSYKFAEDEDTDDEDDENSDGMSESRENDSTIQDVTTSVRQDLDAECLEEVIDAAQSLETSTSDVGQGREPIRASLSYPDNGRASYYVDLRHPSSQDDRPPTLLDRAVDNPLYDFMDVATRHTLNAFWYMMVSNYSSRRLTFPFDKLPALAGIASRIHAITKDDYLAGHWRRELERSLFWSTVTKSQTGHPGRVKEYRAPSWSWASVDALTDWAFPDLAPGMDVHAPVEILEAGVDVDGENPFGRVTGGRLLMSVKTLRVNWNANKQGWESNATITPYGDLPTCSLPILGSEGTYIGFWAYDDLVNGILPGPPLTQHTPIAEVHKRSVPCGYFGSVQASNIRVHGEDAKDSSTLWKRGTYVPEELVLVKGPTKRLSKSEQEWYGRSTSTEVEVLVLARTEGPEGEYRRVGVGNLGTWDDAAERVEVLTFV